jgi:hypothetical protein
VACVCALFCSGCFTKKRPVFAMSQLTLGHPVVPPAADIRLDDAPEISVELEPVPRLVIPHGVPPRPHVATATAPGPPPTEKPTEPILAPELSDVQLSAAKSETQQSLGAAERNLALTEGKPLNATQQDVVSKIRGFMDSAREAIKNSDWPRARTQAKKAEVLSREFAPNP